MSLDADVAAILAATPSLSAVFTGGILDYAALGTLGLNRIGYPAAFDATTGLLKPTIVVRDRDANTTFAMTGEQEQISSYMQACEIVLYADRGYPNVYDVFDTALKTIYGLLHDRNVVSVRMRRVKHSTNLREPLLDYAAYSFDVYMGQGLQKP